MRNYVSDDHSKYNFYLLTYIVSLHKVQIDRDNFLIIPDYINWGVRKRKKTLIQLNKCMRKKIWSLDKMNRMKLNMIQEQTKRIRLSVSSCNLNTIDYFMGEVIPSRD